MGKEEPHPPSRNTCHLALLPIQKPAFMAARNRDKSILYGALKMLDALGIILGEGIVCPSTC